MHYELRVVGNPIAHSHSPTIHHEFAKQTGLSVNYQTVLAPISAFAETIRELQLGHIHGVNITHPFKMQAFSLANSHSISAKIAKSANTFVIKTEEIYADNTDGAGLITDIQKNIGYSLQKKRILICGAGGAVRGILHPIIAELPASLSIVNRNVNKAYEIAQEFKKYMPMQSYGYQELENHEFDVIIDGTAQSSDSLPFPPTLLLSNNSLCYDLKYQVNGAFTNWAFSKKASKIHNGIGMLVEQAAEAFKIWTGKTPTTAPVIALLRAQRL